MDPSSFPTTLDLSLSFSAPVSRALSVPLALVHTGIPWVLTSSIEDRFTPASPVRKMSKPTKNALKIRAEDLDSDDVDAEQETDLDDDQSSTQSADKKPSTKPMSPKEKGEDILARLVPTPPKKSKTIKLSSSSSVVKGKFDGFDTAPLPPPKTPSEQMAQGPDGLLAAAHFGPKMEESLDGRVPTSNIVIGHQMATAQVGEFPHSRQHCCWLPL